MDYDDQLVDRLAVGDRSALAALIARWRRPLIAYFARRTNIKLDFELLAGATLDKVAASASSYVARGRFGSWLFKIAHNVLLDELRRNQRERERNGLWHVTKHGSMGTKKRIAGVIEKDDEEDHLSPNDEVVDVSFHTRGVDVSMRFRPGELRRKGYSLPSELKRMFRHFGLVDGPTPDIWKKSYNMEKINDSKCAFGDVILTRGGYPPTNGESPPVELVSATGITQCCICARRTQCQRIGTDYVCRGCEREAASNWFVSRQLEILQS